MQLCTTWYNHTPPHTLEKLPMGPTKAHPVQCHCRLKCLCTESSNGSHTVKCDSDLEEPRGDLGSRALCLRDNILSTQINLGLQKSEHHILGFLCTRVESAGEAEFPKYLARTRPWYKAHVSLVAGQRHFRKTEWGVVSEWP